MKCEKTDEKRENFYWRRIIMKKVLDIVGISIISIVIILFNLMIGANEKRLRILPIGIMLLLVLSYLIARKILLKQKIVIKNKIDIFALLFMCSTLLPYIFKTYCSYQSTIEFILKYFFVYAMYLAIRNTVDSKSKIDILIVITIISSLQIAILGIDMQHNQYFDWIIQKLNLKYSASYELSSTFGYANTVAIYFSFCIFLAINQIQNVTKKRFKILYIIYIVLALYIIYQTKSRAVFAIFILAVIIYFCIYYLQNILENKKKLIKVILSLTLLGVILLTFIFTIATKVSTSYEFSDATYERYFNYNFEENEKYTIELELDIENIKEDEERNIEIRIMEVNPYFNEKMLITSQINSEAKLVSLDFQTNNPYQIYMLIVNEHNKKITIKKCYINGSEYIINYKFLPYNIGEALTTYSTNDKGIKQRIYFWKDCIKIAKEHLIIGQGGNTWKQLSRAVQDSPYSIKEAHSYFFELLISYGIVGVTLFLILIICFNTRIIQECIKNKQQRQYKLSILFGLDLIILHSLCFDFNMSFLIILLIVFSYIAALMYDSKEEIQKLKILDYGVLLFLSIILIILILANVARYATTDKTLKKKLGFYNAGYQYDYIVENIEKENDFRFTLNEIQKLMKKEPYNYQDELYKKYWNLILNNLENLEDNELTDYLEFINHQYRTVKFVTPMYIDTILSRVYTMENAYLTLEETKYDSQDVKEQVEQLKQIIKEGYEANIVNIKDKERNGSSAENINYIIKQYDEILEKID